MAITIAILLGVIAAQAIFTCGCSSWQQTAKTTLGAAYIGATGTEAAAKGHFEVRCKSVAFSCFAVNDKVCEPLVRCQAERRKVVDIVVKIYAGIAAGYSALALGDEGATSTVVQKVLKLVVDLQAIAKKAGLL